MITDLVSTIIPVRNRPTLLASAVNSVLEQTHRPIEIIIADDHSTDETPRVAEELSREYPDVIQVVSSQTRGAGPAREAGRCLARGEFIQYLDSDDLLRSDKFSRQVEALRENPDCGVAYGRSLRTTLDGKVLADPYRWTGREFRELFPGLLIYRWWSTHTPLYRRSVTDAIGPWSHLRYSQDWEYDSRVGALNIKLVYCDFVVGEERVHSGIRQTGTGRWLTPPERVRFFTLLFERARQAGVPIVSPEMRHFSRWLFHHSRDCAASGHVESARKCLELCLRASHRPEWDVRLYQGLSRLAGWRTTGRLSRWLISTTNRRPGRKTLDLSNPSGNHVG